MTKGSNTALRPRIGKRFDPSHAAKFRIGGRICIVRGAFEGAEGVVYAVKDGHRYVLTVDGLPPGVYIAVEEDAIVAVQR